MTFDDIPQGVSVFLDANTFVYHFAPKANFRAECSNLLDRIQCGELTGVTSSDVLSDVAHRLMTYEAADMYSWSMSGIAYKLQQQSDKIKGLSKFRQAIENIPKFEVQILSVHASHVLAAASLSQQFGLLSGDALIAAAYLYSTTAGTYLVKLTVDDGLKTDSEVLVVTIGVNQSPVADASLSQTVIVSGDGSARLDGTLSHDPDDTQLFFNWQVVASSNGKTPTISRSTSAVAFLYSTIPGIYAIELTVGDGLSTSTDYVIVEVTGNQIPLVDVSLSDRVVTAGTNPQLNASRTFDPDGDPLHFSWVLVASSNHESPVIVNPNESVTEIETPPPGSYTFRLAVDDGSSIATAFVLVTVREAPAMAGDFDGNGSVNGRDFLVWQRSYGASDGPLSDGNLDGAVDNTDLTIWTNSYQNSTSATVRAADFDADGDVDGRDFLAWQRNPQINAINDWQADYGAPGPPAFAAASLASVDSPPSNSSQLSNLELVDARLLLYGHRSQPRK